MSLVLPKLSIVTVCYNCIDEIEKTILSIIDQDYSNLEFIVIDGGSTDGTIDVINNYLNYISFFVSEKDEGIFHAMNKGLSFATGNWVNFMNAGDFFYEVNTLSKVFNNSIPINVGVLYGNTVNNGIVRNASPLHSLYFGGIMACHQSIFYNRMICDNLLFYHTKHKYYGDIELTRRLYLKGINFLYLNLTISVYKGGGFSSLVSRSARIAKFDYLYDNLGFIGLVYGVIGKIIFLLKKLRNNLLSFF